MIKKIFVHAVNLKVGGGKSNLDGIIKSISEKAPNGIKYIILTPSYEFYNKYESQSCHVVKNPPKWIMNLFPFYYLIYLPFIFNKYEVDLILNLGDIVIPSKIKQIYFFDWAYAVYDETYIWNDMSLVPKLLRKLKIYLIELFIEKYTYHVIAQTENIRKRLLKKYDVKVTVIATPLTLPNELLKNGKNNDTDLRLFYPASYSSHKNHKYLANVAVLASERNLGIKFILTLSEKEWVDFKSLITSPKIIKHFENKGILTRDKLWEEYSVSNIVIIPSLLESYGLPFYEAMFAKKPLFVSDLDFSRDACKDAAIYFNPFFPLSCVEQIEKYLNCHFDSEEYQTKAKSIINKIPNWSEWITAFELSFIFNDSNKRHNI